MDRLARHIFRISVWNFKSELLHGSYLYLLTPIYSYMTELLSKLNSERRSRGIRRVLKAKKISDDISAYRQQVQAIQEDFLVGGLLLPSRFPLTGSQIRTTTTTQLVLSDVQDQVNTRFSALACAMGASESNITSVIKDNTKEIRTSGVLQSETIEKLQVALRDFQQRGFYKGVVCPFDKLIMFLPFDFSTSAGPGPHSRRYIS